MNLKFMEFQLWHVVRQWKIGKQTMWVTKYHSDISGKKINGVNGLGCSSIILDELGEK